MLRFFLFAMIKITKSKTSFPEHLFATDEDKKVFTDHCLLIRDYTVILNGSGHNIRDLVIKAIKEIIKIKEKP